MQYIFTKLFICWLSFADFTILTFIIVIFYILTMRSFNIPKVHTILLYIIIDILIVFNSFNFQFVLILYKSFFIKKKLLLYCWIFDIITWQFWVNSITNKPDFGYWWHLVPFSVIITLTLPSHTCLFPLSPNRQLWQDYGRIIKSLNNSSIWVLDAN